MTPSLLRHRAPPASDEAGVEAGGPVSSLTDRTVPVGSVPGLPGHPSDPVDIAALERRLRSVLPGPEPAAAGREAGDVVALAAGDPVDWAGLALDLGYTDQPHLVRDLTALFGEPPTHYARRYPTR